MILETQKILFLHSTKESFKLVHFSELEILSQNSVTNSQVNERFTSLLKRICNEVFLRGVSKTERENKKNPF